MCLNDCVLPEDVLNEQASAIIAVFSAFNLGYLNLTYIKY
jgi:hypothetical protein